MNDNELIKEINKLKIEKNAVILSHNYLRDEVQNIADYTGDSLGLSRKAVNVDADIIVFCGVYFMAETAKILSPQKKVLLPDLKAGCPMADMITANELIEFKAKHKDSVVVCYVNSTAEIKAESDICCTSSNALEVIESIDKDKTILFVPDKYLGGYIKEQTGRNIICWNGFCPTHAKLNGDMVVNAKKRHPNAIVMVHPECPEDVVAKADHTISTGQMIELAKTSSATEFIVGTEKGILCQLRKDNPHKEFYMINKEIICPNMKKITLEKLYNVLKNESNEIVVDENIAKAAKVSIDRMLEIK